MASPRSAAMRHFATLAHDAAASDASPSERFERLLAELRAAEDLSAAAQANVASFDYDFMRRLMERNQVTEDLEETRTLERIGEAINMAMQQELVRADQLLRGILKSGDLRLMEATMRKHLRANDLTMAFDVVLGFNLQEAKQRPDSEAAERLLQHLSTVLAEERDKRLPTEVRVLRMLLRTECDGARKRMLFDKLILPKGSIKGQGAAERAAGDGEADAEESMWGPPEVTPESLNEELGRFLAQLESMGADIDSDVLERAIKLREQITEVVRGQ